MVHLRNFRKEDLPGLYVLDQSCFPPDIAYSLADLKYLLENSRCFSRIAETGDRPLAGLIIVERKLRRGAGHVITIDVDPECRRQGIGRRLLEAAERRLQSEGATLMILEVAEDNTSAQAFYRSFGYQEAARIPNYYAGRLAARVMEKEI